MDCAEILRALRQFIKAADAFTIPTDEGRKLTVAYADKALSDAYDEFMPLAIGARVNALARSAVRSSPSSTAAAIDTFTVPIGKGGLDPSLATFFGLLDGPLSYPVARHNEENAKKPGGPHQRFRFGDAITEQDWQQILAAERSLALHVDRSHAETAADRAPVQGSAEPYCGGDSRYPSSEWIEIAKAARDLGESSSNLHRWVKDLPASDKGETEPVRKIVVRRDALRAVIAKRRAARGR